MNGTRPTIRRVPGQGWGGYSEGELVGVYETRTRARRAAAEMTERLEDDFVQPEPADGSWGGWPLGEPEEDL